MSRRHLGIVCGLNQGVAHRSGRNRRGRMIRGRRRNRSGGNGGRSCRGLNCGGLSRCRGRRKERRMILRLRYRKDTWSQLYRRKGFRTDRQTLQMPRRFRFRYRRRSSRIAYQVRHVPYRPHRRAHDRPFRHPVFALRRGRRREKGQGAHHAARRLIGPLVPYRFDPQYGRSVDIYVESKQ